MRTFSTIPQLSYVGRLNSLPTQTLNTKFSNQPPLPPSIVATIFDWATYGAGTLTPNINVLVSLPAVGGARQLLDRVLSVRIDNLGNPVPVYVYFPDTGYTVAAPPNSVVWEPVETGQFDCWVIGEGFTNANLGTTAVYLCNFKSAPYIDNEFPQTAVLWKASPSITRGGTIFNQNFGIPALGDQLETFDVTVATANINTNVFGGVATSGFFYLTELEVYAVSMFTTVDVTVQQFFESTGIAGILYNFTFSLEGPKKFEPLQITRMSHQLKLDATQHWQVRNVLPLGVTAGAGFLSYRLAFTYNPD